MQKFPVKFLVVLCLSVSAQIAHADDATAAQRSVTSTPAKNVASPAPKGAVAALLDKSFAFLGVRYRMGGNGPAAGGFDCSGLVRKVFGDALGLNLPRTAAEMAQLGDKVNPADLKPGDLVFFNTMRRAFSHVGIYVGDNKFLHSPSVGSAVRVDDFDSAYWSKHFTGGRRLISEAQAAPMLPPNAPAVAAPIGNNGVGNGNLTPPPLLARPLDQENMQ
jgi:cell wall-associated NlpC family hydrolase